MKILVCVSKTPDTTTKIAFTNGDTALNVAGVQFIMNPYDEWYALVRAIELKEQHGGTVTILHVGDAGSEAIIRKGLAIGADDAVRIDAEPTGTLFIAKQIAAYAKSQSFDLIFLGKESIDYNGSEVGAMVAELMDLPYVSYAVSIEVQGGTAVVSRDIEGGQEKVQVATPFVLSAAKGMAEQRIPNMQGIMMSKRKPLQVLPAVGEGNPVKAVKFEQPKPKSACRMVDPNQMEELVALLHTEAKVI